MSELSILATAETVAVFGAIAGCYACLLAMAINLFKHAYEKDRHPSTSHIVYRDVCETKHAGAQNTLQAELRAVNCRIDDLKGEVSEGFRTLKTLMTKMTPPE